MRSTQIFWIALASDYLLVIVEDNFERKSGEVFIVEAKTISLNHSLWGQDWPGFIALTSFLMVGSVLCLHFLAT